LERKPSKPGHRDSLLSGLAAGVGLSSAVVKPKEPSFPSHHPGSGANNNNNTNNSNKNNDFSGELDIHFVDMDMRVKHHHNVASPEEPQRTSSASALWGVFSTTPKHYVEAFLGGSQVRC